MIIITGAAGFIGSNIVKRLNDSGYHDLVLVDDFTKAGKEKNYSGKSFSLQVERDDFIEWIDHNHTLVQFIIHMGARTDTAEMDKSVFDHLNLDYSRAIWNQCIKYGLPLIYASSAATYGDGSLGFTDDEEKLKLLKPLNPYGDSKNEFDKWAVEQEKKPFFWAGLKFFNVYGPNEYHKGRMASVIFHAFNQIKSTGEMKLFRSHHSGYKDGEQLRDFIYVKDLCDVVIFLMEERPQSGIFNLGTGKAESFLELVQQTFKVMGQKEKITFIDTPEDIRDKYQYFTEAKMDKLRKAGYTKAFRTLSEGVPDYVGNYLLKGKYN